MVVRRLGRALREAGFTFFLVRLAAAQGASPGATAAFPVGPPPAASAPAAAPPAASAPPAMTAAPAPANPPPAPPTGAPPAYSAPPSGYYSQPPAAGQYPAHENEYLSPEQSARKARAARVVSLTISPLHLIFPVLEITAEARLVNHFGLAVVGGFGSVTPKDSSTSYRAKELGVQALFYPLEAFDSLVLGGELMYLSISLDDTGQSVTGLASGTAVGPLVGYKLIATGGFTFFAHIGAQYLTAQANAQSTTNGSTAQANANQWIALLNLNVGWSF